MRSNRKKMKQTHANSAPQPQVVIVGGGFAGLSAAKALRDAPVAVTLVDRTNHYLFQPLLYQVATGLLSPADIAVPTRFLLRDQQNADVLMATVHRIDTARRIVFADDREIPYDFLILAPGARHAYFGHPEWERVAPGLKTLDDAREIRTRYLLAFEEAEKTTDPAAHQALLTFVIVGGGPTGVELAGILPTISRKGIRGDFRNVDPACSRVLLLEAGPRVLPTFPADLSERAKRDLEALGVEVRTGALVTHVTADAVYVGDERIPARTVFWAAGNEASPLIKSLGVPVDKAGRALVGPDLAVPDRPEIFIVGDAAAARLMDARESSDPDSKPQFVPGLAAAANQMGAHAAKMTLRSLQRRPRRPFRYRHRGTMAVIGRGRAIADFKRVTLTGRLAFFTWLFVHLAYLAGFRNRVSVMVEWAYAYFTYRPGARLINDQDRLLVEASDRSNTERRRAS